MCDVVMVRVLLCMRVGLGGRVRDIVHVRAGRRNDMHGRRSWTGVCAQLRGSMCDVVVVRASLCMRVGRGGRVRDIVHVRACRLR